jgi:hypothetical protein
MSANTSSKLGARFQIDVLSLSLFFNLHEEWIKWRSTATGNDYDFANVDGNKRYQRMACF